MAWAKIIKFTNYGTSSSEIRCCQETMELMTLFYSDLTKTLNPVTSFDKAQKEMRNKYPTDPEKWAGFVLVR